MAKNVRITVLVEGGRHPTLMGSGAVCRTRPMVGLSLFVEVVGMEKSYKILMDTGTSWKRLKHNAEALHVPLDQIDCGFVSHWHFDHTGALPSLVDTMQVCPPFYVPVREPQFCLLNGFIEKRLPAKFHRIEIEHPREIQPGIFSTGSLDAAFPLQRHPVHEQALGIVLEGQGLVLLVGCAHPKPQDLAQRALAFSGESRIALLLGGLHLIPPAKEGEIREIAEALYALDIERIAPCHCTGKKGIQYIQDVFQDRCMAVSLGDVIEIGP